MNFLHEFGYDERYIKRGIILDTKPLLFLLTGLFDEENQNRTDYIKETNYSKEDFNKFRDFLKKFEKILVTPHILAELSNLLNRGRYKSNFKHIMTFFCRKLLAYDEKNICKNYVLKRNEVDFLGLTDVSILLISERDDCLVIVEDEYLLRTCEKNNIKVIPLDYILYQ